LHHAHVAYPYAVRKAGAHALDDGLLGGEAHRDEAHRARGSFELHPLLGHEQMRQKALTMLAVDVFDALDFQHVDADPVDHGADAGLEIAATGIRPAPRASMLSC